MSADNEITKINAKVVLLSYVFNPGAIIVGLAVYGLQLDKGPFGFISTHHYTNHVMLMVGVMLFCVNLFFILKLSKKKKMLEQNMNEELSKSRPLFKNLNR